MKNVKPFRDRYLELTRALRPSNPDQGLIVRHDETGQPIDAHPPCDATQARLRAARKLSWPPRGSE